MRKTPRKWMCLAICMVIMACVLTGCSSNSPKKTTVQITAEPTESIPQVSIAPAAENSSSETIQPEPATAIDGMTKEQKNSLNMLNYLAYISQDILAKKNNRIFIEQVYTSLLNDINPSTVNDYTEAHYDELLDRLHEFEKLLTKRDRLQYLFEQNQAAAIRGAIPNPIGLLSAVSSMNIASLVSSVVYMAVDAVSSYASGMSSAEQTFLQQSWELDDDESDTIHSLRKQTFMYMVEVVKGYTLPDRLTLTENSVDKLVEWNERTPEEESPASRVHFYKTYESDYEGFGLYWLARAKAHFDNKEYEECLKAFQRYENLQIGIYRRDYELAKALPIAIGAASQIYDDQNYTITAGRYADMIQANTDIKKDWALRYFAAQTYIDISGRTGNKDYLQKAYKIALENVNELKAEQKKLNNTYIMPLVPEEIPQGTPDSKKKEIEAYNKQKQTERETELPPVYEPLKLNLDLLYALASQIELTEAERNEIDRIIYVDGKSLFLNNHINALYQTTNNDKPEISFNGKDIGVPVCYLTQDAQVGIELWDAEDGLIADWVLTKVERKDANNPESFFANYHSKKAESFDYKKAEGLTVTIWGSDYEYTYDYSIKKSKDWVILDKVEFELQQ